MLHYELCFGLYKLVNVHTRRSSMLPLSFMVLCDEDGKSLYKDNDALRSILNEVLMEYPEIISPFLKGKRGCEYNINDIGMMEEMIIMNEKSYSTTPNGIRGDIILSSIQNMVIELRTERKTFFAFSNSIPWNVIAMNLAMANDIGMNFEKENSLRYFTSELYSDDLLKGLMEFSRYSHISNTMFEVTNNVAFNMRMSLDETDFLDREAVKLKAASILFEKYQLIGTEYSFTKDMLQILENASPDDHTLLIASEEYEQLESPIGLSRVPLMEIQLKDNKKQEITVRYLYNKQGKSLWRSIKPIEYSSTIELPKSADILYKIFR